VIFVHPKAGSGVRAGLTAAVDPEWSYKDQNRSGRWVPADAGFRDLLIPVWKSGLGVQPFDL